MQVTVGVVLSLKGGYAGMTDSRAWYLHLYLSVYSSCTIKMSIGRWVVLKNQLGARAVYTLSFLDKILCFA